MRSKNGYYEDELYEDESYDDESYDDESYEDESYDDETYDNETYENDSYDDNDENQLDYDEHDESDDTDETDYDIDDISSGDLSAEDMKALDTPDKREAIKGIMQDYHSGDEELKQKAKERLFVENDSFIYFMIKKYFRAFMKEYKRDLYNECCVAILDHLDEFNPESGTFATFFTSHMLHQMSLFVNREVNKASAYYAGQMNSIRKAIRHYEKLQKTPTVSDIALYTNLSVKNVEEGLKKIEFANERRYQTEAELDGLIRDYATTPEEEMLEKERHEALMSAFSKLDSLDKKLLVLKFGLLDNKQRSYSAIAKECGISVNDATKSISRSLRLLSDCEEFTRLYGETQKRKKEDGMKSIEISLTQSKNVIDIYASLDDFEEDMVSICPNKDKPANFGAFVVKLD